MSFSKCYLVIGLSFGAIGMVLGIVMAASHDHGQHVTHAHLMLLGMVLSVLYGLIHRLWLHQARLWLARLQLGCHLFGAVGIGLGLFLLYGKFVQPPAIEPLLILASFSALAGLLLMLALVLCSKE